MFNFSEDLKPELKSERKLKNEPLTKPVSEQVLNKSCTGNETSTEQAVVPSINDRNKTNNANNQNVANLDEQAKNIIAKNEAPEATPNGAELISDENNLNFKNQAEDIEKEKSSAKKEKDVDDFVIPSEAEVSPL